MPPMFWTLPTLLTWAHIVAIPLIAGPGGLTTAVAEPTRRGGGAARVGERR